MLLFTDVKINLGLDILRRRPDGYHDISTVMIPVPWHDILEAVPSADGSTTLHCSGRTVDCPAEKNLVMKAYRRLSRDVELPGTDIYLHKTVPDGAGLGGGSADAASTLLLLNDLYSLGLSREELAGMAAEIGADCPFFIYNRPMLATGIGEVLTPVKIDLTGYTLMIAKPPVSVSTAEAYSRVVPHVPDTDLAERIARPVSEWRHCLTNAFEESVFRLHPYLASIKDALYGYGAVYASMSGSGTAIFGLFDDKDGGDNVSHAWRALSARSTHLDIFNCKL